MPKTAPLKLVGRVIDEGDGFTGYVCVNHKIHTAINNDLLGFEVWTELKPTEKAATEAADNYVKACLGKRTGYIIAWR